MATVITSECINCAACEPECPNTAIYQGGVEWELGGTRHAPLASAIFYIVPDKCSECVGFHEVEACAAVCPVECCVPDPNRPETEAELIARARALHPEQAFPDPYPSRFRPTGASLPLHEPAQPVRTPNPPPAASPAVAATQAEAAPPPPVTGESTAALATDPVSGPQPPAASPAPERATAAPVPAAPPAERPAAVRTEGVPESTRGGAAIDTVSVPVHCFRCGRSYTVAYKHFRTGAVLFCPACKGSCVVTASMHAAVRRIVDRLRERAGAEMDEIEAALATASQAFEPPGAPRKRTGLFA